ncbi:response regulator transcription factor [Dyadobacter psychrotolerans]|uniref:Response regulator transcription factor n=1 Tax=Dyadobacter psychrotolerans TaxID=2541721 RepID=A0A4R5DHE8_9BACT|nr:response regulator transcription factor [Dyadobacter psychrotolerans]TDE11284.1 response regulator transcription factor [Dyadobacter psychrotolerans]
MKIAIIEDHFIFRLGLICLLKKHYADPYILETSHTNDYETDIIKFTPDLIILSLNNIHERTGYNLVLKIKLLFPETPVIVYDASVNYTKALKALKAKASGYLSKSGTEAEFIKCADTVMERKNYLCTSVQQNIIEHVIQKRGAMKMPGNLSMRELEIARMISEGEKTSNIAQSLGLKSSTISTVKAKIFTKMEVNNVLELRVKMAGISNY